MKTITKTDGDGNIYEVPDEDFMDRDPYYYEDRAYQREQMKFRSKFKHCRI